MRVIHIECEHHFLEGLSLLTMMKAFGGLAAQADVERQFARSCRVNLGASSARSANTSGLLFSPTPRAPVRSRDIGKGGTWAAPLRRMLLLAAAKDIPTSPPNSEGKRQCFGCCRGCLQTCGCKPQRPSPVHGDRKSIVGGEDTSAPRWNTPRRQHSEHCSFLSLSHLMEPKGALLLLSGGGLFVFALSGLFYVHHLAPDYGRSLL